MVGFLRLLVISAAAATLSIALSGATIADTGSSCIDFRAWMHDGTASGLLRAIRPESAGQISFNFAFVENRTGEAEALLSVTKDPSPRIHIYVLSIGKMMSVDVKAVSLDLGDVIRDNPEGLASTHNVWTFWSETSGVSLEIEQVSAYGEATSSHIDIIGRLQLVPVKGGCRPQ